VSDLQCPATMLIAAHGDAQCAGDGALTDQGRAQVRHLVEAVADRRVAAVCSSGSQRAVESAQLAASALGLAAVVVDGLQEPPAGDLAGVSLQDEALAQVRRALSRAGPDIGWPTAQDGRLVVRRFAQAIGEIADTHRGETVLVFTHAQVMALAIRTLSVNVGRDLAAAPLPAHCAVAEVEVDADGWRLVSWPGSSEQA
jgi:probable phosphoglycerate mutase